MCSKCINCLVDITEVDDEGSGCKLEDVFDFEKKIFAKPKSRKKRGRQPYSTVHSAIGIEAFQILDLIFQINDRKLNLPSPQDGLCNNCAGTLGQLFHSYFQFVSASRLSSYISDTLQTIESLQRNLGQYLPIKSKRSVPSRDLGSKDMLPKSSSRKGSDSCLLLQSKNKLIVSSPPAGAGPIIDDENTLSQETKLPNLGMDSVLEVKLEPMDVDIDMHLFEDSFPLEDIDETTTTISSRPQRKCANRISVRKRPRKSRLSSHTTTRSTEVSKSVSKPEGGAHSCKKCCDVFNQKSQFHIHMKSHVEATKHQCPTCKCCFKTYFQLRAHVFKCHDTDSNCTMCDSKFMTPAGLMRHLVDRHLYCSICDTSHSTVKVATAHMEETHGHLWYKPLYKCDLCPYQTKKRHYLKRHQVLVHLEPGPLSCHVCGKNFSVNNTLTKHMRVHTDERPYKCDRCPMTFKYSENLKVHKLIHDGVKCICDICGHASSSAANLCKHMAGVHHRVRQVQRKTPDELKKKRLTSKVNVTSITVQEESKNPNLQQLQLQPIPHSQPESHLQ